MPRSPRKRPKAVAFSGVYESPLVGRNASRDMAELFSPLRRASVWRRIWLALAEAQHEMGLAIKVTQLRELRAHLEDINLDAVRRHEAKLRHDVMAHLHAYGDVAPGARG
ncbi:MAG TPA: hypothetical protein VNT79_06380, partial [Phycisphaerae bacterium]|nr:hypothetical protein [Phycisphaerae bacterium]